MLRLILMAGFLPLFGVLRAVHWTERLFDEIFRHVYREARILEPVFIPGASRGRMNAARPNARAEPCRKRGRAGNFGNRASGGVIKMMIRRTQKFLK